MDLVELILMGAVVWVPSDSQPIFESSYGPGDGEGSGFGCGIADGCGDGVGSSRGDENWSDSMVGCCGISHLDRLTTPSGGNGAGGGGENVFRLGDLDESAEYRWTW